MKPTPLRDSHAALGATLVDFAGWEMPLRYGSETKEHLAVRESAGIFDLSHMGEIEVVGPQADQFLDFALVNRPSLIEPGRARYSMICDESGGVIDDLVVYRLAADRYMVVANASNAVDVLAELQSRAAAFDVAVHDSLDDWALVAVQGPNASAIVEKLVGSSTFDLRYYAIRTDRIGDIEVRLARTGYTGEDGFEIYCAASAAPAVWLRALEAGEGAGLVPVGLAARDSLRLEAGMPLYGNELSRDMTPFDAGLGRVVAFDKPGSFVGEAALVRRQKESAGRVLRGLRSAGRRPLRHGYEVVAADGRVVGVVTSGIVSPTLGTPIAMAYVDPDVADDGVQLIVPVRGSEERVTVTSLPFYKRA